MSFERSLKKIIYLQVKSSYLLESYFRRNSIFMSERFICVNRSTKIELIISSGFLWEIIIDSFFNLDNLDRIFDESLN